MTKLIPTLVIGAILASSTVGIAQDKKESKGAKRGQALEQRVDRMAQDLNLKEEQKTKLKALFEDQQKKFTALREDTSLPQQERRQKSRAIQEDVDKKMKEILTTEQYDKWQKQREANAEKMKKRGDRKGKRNESK